MKKIMFIVSMIYCLAFSVKSQSYNTLWIPDTLSGTSFNLAIKDTFAQIINTGNQTITGGINGKIWGPTLFFNKGDSVRFNVHNYLNESTTIHWHGMHLPAVMDGGPHQVIPSGTIWKPYWKVDNNAATYWYHPHLHEMTVEQITKGIGGLIIVRDPKERALALPRTYGIDDIPLIITDRKFTSLNQFSIAPYGDSIMVNGTLRAKYSIPAQVVRFRILNAAIERSYNIGFSDGRSFSVITSDGGLLNAPVSVTKYILHAGERIEILANFVGQSGQSVNLKAFNSLLPNSVPGGETFTTGPFGSFLNHQDFVLVHFNVTSQTTSPTPIVNIPTTLVTNTLLSSVNAVITRSLTISDSTGVTNPAILGPNAFVLNHKLFDINYINYSVPLNNTEIWQITSSSVFGHPFHIHDVEFNIISVNGVAPTPAQAGWKDVVFIPARTNPSSPAIVKFIAKFDDFADATYPFMFHCHIALHEDEGMMGQFVVTNPSGLNETKKDLIAYSLFPNPVDDKLFIKLDNTAIEIYYITITNVNGKAVMMLPQPEINKGIDVSSLAKGIYFVQLMDKKTKSISTQKFVKE